MRKKVIFLIVIGFIFALIGFYLSSCTPRGIGGGPILAGLLQDQPSVFGVSTFKMTGSNPQPLEFAFAYYNNTFEPFRFVNYNLTSNSFVSFSFSNNFASQISGRKVLIFGSGWVRGNADATSKEIFWVGKIINSNLNASDIGTSGGFKFIIGRNFVARVSVPGAFDSNFDNLRLRKDDNFSDYQITDFDDPNQDFRAVNFVPFSTSSYIGAIAGRNVAFYSTTNNNNLSTWQNAINNNNQNDPNRPSNFIAFDVIPSGSITNPFVIIIGSDAGETQGEFRVYSSFSNSWGINLASSFTPYIGNNPLYSADYVGAANQVDRIDTAGVCGRGSLGFYKDSNTDGIADPPGAGDLWIFYSNPNINFYGINIIKDTNNNRFIAVGYDNVSQKAVIYRGIVQDSNNDLMLDNNVGGNNNPIEVDLSNLNLDLKEIVFFDVNSSGENVFVVGVDTSNCNIKPYPSPGVPTLTKSLLFPAATTSDADIIDLFQDMRGVILYSNDGGQSFNLISSLLK